MHSKEIWNLEENVKKKKTYSKNFIKMNRLNKEDKINAQNSLKIPKMSLYKYLSVVFKA